jgi:hypothetical protein
MRAQPEAKTAEERAAGVVCSSAGQDADTLMKAVVEWQDLRKSYLCKPELVGSFS